MGSTKITTLESIRTIPNTRANDIGFRIKPKISSTQYKNLKRDGIGFDIDGKIVNPLKINLSRSTMEKVKEKRNE